MFLNSLDRREMSSVEMFSISYAWKQYHYIVGKQFEMYL